MLRKLGFVVAAVAFLSAAPVRSARADSAADVQVCLETIGVLGGLGMFDTYHLVGAVADAYAKKVYDKDTVLASMGAQHGAIEVVIESLMKVRALPGATVSDKQSIDAMVEVYQLLDNEAGSLAAFAKSGDKKDSQAYESARTKVWPKIQKLLGLK